MILYTIQHVDMYKNSLEVGYLHTSKWLKMFTKEYTWMYNQYAKRCKIDELDVERDLIWWWGNKPDLRCIGYAKRGTDLVLLKANIEDCKVLASDFDGWHYVLNNWHIATNEKEDDYYIRLIGEDYEKYADKKEKSWELIFNTSLLCSCDYVTGGCQTLQYVTGKIPVQDVEVVRYFKAK